MSVPPGRRALGIAESYRGRDDGTTSTVCGAVVRADRTVDDAEFSGCTVGGTDATDAVIEVWDRLERPDVRYVLVAGVALAWYNIVDLGSVADRIDRPVIAVSFEDSDGLGDAIADAFDGGGRARRLEAYRALPERRRVDTDEGPLFYRHVGIDDAAAESVVDAYTHERRPEPLRVAGRLAGRVDAARRDGVFEDG